MVVGLEDALLWSSVIGTIVCLYPLATSPKYSITLEDVGELFERGYHKLVREHEE